MKLKLFLIFLLGWSKVLFSQGNVGINTTTPHQNAVLELYSTTKGFLPPRLTAVQRDAITPKPAGLTIYNSILTVCNIGMEQNGAVLIVKVHYQSL